MANNGNDDPLANTQEECYGGIRSVEDCFEALSQDIRGKIFGKFDNWIYS